VSAFRHIQASGRSIPRVFDDFSPDLAKAAFTVGNILPNLLAPTVLNLSPACLSHG